MTDRDSLFVASLITAGMAELGVPLTVEFDVPSGEWYAYPSQYRTLPIPRPGEFATREFSLLVELLQGKLAEHADEMHGLVKTLDKIAAIK